MSDTRHRQLSRIYGRTIETDEDARTAITGDPGILASELFMEAVESDDVISIETAKSYLEDRLAFFGGLVAPDAEAIRRGFESKLTAWA